MTSIQETVLAFRTALPSHELVLEKGAMRTWAIAVCDAEVKHADRDFHSIAHDLKVTLAFDRSVDRAALPPVRLPHEQAAGRVLNWASHLITHEGDLRGPWALVMRGEQLRLWRVRWIMLARGFLKAIEVYRTERAALQ